MLALFAIPAPSQAQMLDFDFSEIFDLRPALGLGWAVNDGGAPAVSGKMMLLDAGSGFRLFGAGVGVAKFDEQGLGTKAVFTLIPVAVGGEKWYLAGEITPYSVGRTRVLERSGDVTVTEKKKYGPTILVTLNIRF
jgi:hypothetical protein